MKINMGSWEFTQAKSDAVIQLPEKSVILDLLFQFCYPERHPELNDLAFDISPKQRKSIKCFLPLAFARLLSSALCDMIQVYDF